MFPNSSVYGFGIVGFLGFMGIYQLHLSRVVCCKIYLMIVFLREIQIPGTPVIYALKNCLMLDKPSEKQREFVKSSEEKRSHMTKLESDIVHAIKNKKGSSHPLDDVSEVESIHTLQTAGKNQRQNLGITDKPQFKRKRAKVIFFYTVSV